MARSQLTPESVVKSIKKMKDNWVDSILKREIPARIYAMVHSPDASVRREGVAWVKERGFSHEQEGEYVIVRKGFKVIARTRLMLELDKPEDLRAIAGVVRVRQGGE